MKTILLIILLFACLPLWAMDFPVCKREAEVATLKSLARTLTDTEAQVIVNARRQNAINKINRAKARELACECDNDNPGLQSLLLFIESDFDTVQEQLLMAETSIAQKANAARLGGIALAECQSREQQHHLQLLQDAQLSYENALPRPADGETITAMSGFNFEGLKGFIRESDVNGARTKTFAFAGSQTPLDWACNLSLNISLNPLDRNAKCAKQLKLAMDLQLPAAVEWVKSGKNIQCTGHSLGGALAEGFCAAVMRKVRQDVPGFGDFSKDNRIKVVTFNALGASETFRHAVALAESGRHAAAVPVPVGPNSWLNTNTLHYRVQGDPLAHVSQTPHLMGTVFEKPSTRRVPRSLSRERAGLANMLNSAADFIDDTVRGWRGLAADGAARVADVEICEASADPIRAHEIESCEQIIATPGSWVESRVARVDVPSHY